jgi:serine/threonine protein kinase
MARGGSVIRRQLGRWQTGAGRDDQQERDGAGGAGHAGMMARFRDARVTSEDAPRYAGLMLAGALDKGVVLGGDFVVERLLGSGGMGAVYVAEQKSTGKLRALKVMQVAIAPDAGLQRRFEQEARVGAKIESAHVVDVVAAGVDAPTGLPYLVMELLDGVDLREQLRQRSPLPVSEIGAIFEQLCHGVAAAHAAGIVHRDLKPENIFLARSNRAGSTAVFVKVLDFGIAKLAAEAGTHATAAVGSPLWMAPEQTTPGPVTPAADVWALGLIAYELFTGEHFWRAAASPTSGPMQLLREIVLEPIPPASERGGSRLPPGFDEWFARCVARDPKDRFEDAGQLWRAMQTVLPRTASAPPAQQFAATELGPLPSQHDGPLAGTPPAIVSSGVPARSVAPAPARSSRAVLGVAIGACGLLAGLVIAVRSHSVAQHSESAVNASIPSVPAVPAIPSPRRGRHSPSAAPPDPETDENDDDTPAASPGPPRPDGFADPHDGARMGGSHDSANIVKVRDRQVRLLTKIVSNGSNVTDSVVKGAMEWSSWDYQRCYQRIFGPHPSLEEGTVRVSFDILDQLPRHAALQDSTFASTEMGPCIVQTVSGKTINAARAAGSGHVVYAFKFVLMD